MGRGPASGTREGGGKLKKGAWTTHEDKILRDYVAAHGDRRWNIVARETGLRRCAKSCRLRWLNYLRPDIKRGNITKDEEDLIIRLHKLLGNRWSLIAGRLPGRTDNEMKNYWNTTLAKKTKAGQQFNDKSVTDQKQIDPETFEMEKPSGLLHHQDNPKSQSLNVDICLEHPTRSDDRDFKLDNTNSSTDNFSAVMTPMEEGFGDFKMESLVEDVGPSATDDFDYIFSRLRADHNSASDGCNNEGSHQDLSGQPLQWLPEGFLENWSDEFASAGDWIIM